MTKLYNLQQIRELERLALEGGATEYELMQRAGSAACKFLFEPWADLKRVAICAGKGNNAGDGFVLARMIKARHLPVVVYTLFEQKDYHGSALRAYQEALAAGVEFKPLKPNARFDADVIVDALLGSGLRNEVQDPVLSAINLINQQDIPKLSLDIPSGLDANTGCIQGAAVNADATITFVGLKQGLFTRKGPEYSGQIKVDSLDIPESLFDQVSSTADIIDWPRVCSVLPRRAQDTHKGHYGHVLVIGGDYGMGGAVRMAAEGALRAGAGLVTVATRPEHVPVVSSSRPEIMCHQVAEVNELKPLIERATVIVIGPGLGRTPWAEALFNEVLKSDAPKLLDADALNLLSLEPIRSENWVLTPHPGEAARLLDISCQELQADRFAAITALQHKYGGTVVLKGSGTLVKDDDELVHVCRAGNPGMASGGMGDILSGIIGGFIAQGLSPAMAAQIGVYIHARAGDLAAQASGERGLLATDVFSHMRALVNPN